MIIHIHFSISRRIFSQVNNVCLVHMATLFQVSAIFVELTFNLIYKIYGIQEFAGHRDCRTSKDMAYVSQCDLLCVSR